MAVARGERVEALGDQLIGLRIELSEREILQLLAEGASSRKMARTLNVSIKTIETHRAQLMERLGIHDVAGLVRFAIRAGLVRAEE